MISILILTVFLVAVSVILLGIRIFFIKDGKFPSSHVGDSPELKRRGITCAKSQDMEERMKGNRRDV